MRRLLDEIRRRRLDRIAIAYGVAAWLIVQAGSIALPTFGAPAWVLKGLIVAAILGFPIALWIAWYLAPHKGPPRTWVTRRFDLALLAGLAAVVLLLILNLAWQASGLFAGHAVGGDPGATARRSSAPRTAVAVLPFSNMSGDPAKEYFSDGISEEILNQLSNVRSLRVPARTSSFAFKGKNEDVRNIARALNVGTVLEGSVREEGRRVRITAQLIDAEDGYHLWSKTYDRDLSNILAVQDEIARAITLQLTSGLLGSGSPASRRTPIDPDAYRRYLQGVSLSARKTDEDDSSAVQLLAEVAAAQPKFAPAYAALGRTFIHMVQFHGERGPYLAKAHAALDAALRLDPHNLEALSSRLLLSLMKWDWSKTAADAHTMQSVNPHSVFTLRALGSYYGAFGFPEQQSAALREATRLDPLSFVDLNNLATVYLQRNQYTEAASAASDALALKPDRPLALYSLCVANAGMKHVREAQELSRKLEELGQPDASRGCSLEMAAALGQRSAVHALADALAARFPTFIFDETEITRYYLLAKDSARASSWLDRAYASRNMDLFAYVYFPSTPPGLVNLPAWKALMRRPEAQAWQRARNRLAAAFSAG